MNIMFADWKCFGKDDMKEAFETLGHKVCFFPFSNDQPHHHEETETRITEQIQKEKGDLLFSFNYFPILAFVAKACNIPYISWVYDCPYVLLYSYTVIFPTNHIYIFDKTQYSEFQKNGIHTIHYLPLAANTARLGNMTDFDTFRASKWNPRKGVSFIGSLYTESHQFYDRLKNISAKTRGYLDGIMAAQKNVYGYNFIEELLLPHIIDDMKKDLPLTPEADSVATTEWLFAQYVINRQITAEERSDYLGAVSSTFGLDLYTKNEAFSMEGVVNYGPVDYYDTAPYVFKESKINLNISLRSIHTGIPLRGFDIIGAGGFLLTNYQADFDDCFEQGVDYDFFSSKEELLYKIDYYLNHDKERSEIARNGYETTAKYHTYLQRAAQMLEDLKTP